VPESLVGSGCVATADNGVCGNEPQIPHTLPDIAAKDARHSAQMGTRLARVSSFSHRRHPAGKKTLTTASPASASHPPNCLPDALRSATSAQAYSSPPDKHSYNLQYSNSSEERHSAPELGKARTWTQQGAARAGHGPAEFSYWVLRYGRPARAGGPACATTILARSFPDN
jgi:hypothetical protein